MKTLNLTFTQHEIEEMVKDAVLRQLQDMGMNSGLINRAKIEVSWSVEANQQDALIFEGAKVSVSAADPFVGQTGKKSK